MKMNVKLLDLDAGGKTIAVLNNRDAQELGVYSLDRIIIETEECSHTAVVNTSEKFVPRGEIAVFDEIRAELNLAAGQQVDVEARGTLKSKQYIRHKLRGVELTPEEIREIIDDVVRKNLNDLELASFITAIYLRGLSLGESASLVEAMVETGSTLSFDGMVCDKHSIGGIPGDKTSLLLVPIIAAAGFKIPKTSSRAVTSPAGTADRAEMLMPVELGLNEIEKAVERTNGCFVWSGAVDLAPAVDLLIQIEHPLDVDPLLLPSILSKKKSAKATHIVIDIPTGSRAKMKTLYDATRLANQFLHIGRQLNMEIRCGLTFGEQPIGYCIGPALEAREALRTFSEATWSDLHEKVVSLCAILFSLVGVVPTTQEGKALAEDLLRRKAERKLRDIIEIQGGDPKILPDDIPLGKYSFTVFSEKKGIIRKINTSGLDRVASAAGCPKDTGAGIQLFKKLGDTVHPGEPLLKVFSEKSTKCQQAEQQIKESELMGIADGWEYVLLTEL